MFPHGCCFTGSYDKYFKAISNYLASKSINTLFLPLIVKLVKYLEIKAVVKAVV